MQKYKNFNVIISDNSDDSGVEDFIQSYKDKFDIIYHRNIPVVNMAENWNMCISLATGQWAKMIHDDDWFSDEHSLQKYADAATDDVSMVFCGYSLYNEQTKQITDKLNTSKAVEKIQANPFLMFYHNMVGPPSTTMFRNNIKETYDTRMTWVVDLDYYFRVIAQSKIRYVPELLVTISYNESQVTNSCFRNRQIEIPEALMCYEKYGSRLLKNMEEYDGWWRFVRNLDIRKDTDFTQNSKGHKVPGFIFDIISFQRRIPMGLLKNGLVSKSAMFLHYLLKFKLST